MYSHADQATVGASGQRRVDNKRVSETKSKQLDTDELDGTSGHVLGRGRETGVTTKTTMEDKNRTHQET